VTDNEKKILKLAAILLDEYAEDRSNARCNDLNPKVEAALKEIIGFQEMAEAWNNGECEDAECYDWIVAHSIAHELNRMSK